MRGFYRLFIFLVFTFLVLGCGKVNYNTSEESLFPSSSKLASPTYSNGNEVADMLLSYNMQTNAPSMRLVANGNKKRNLIEYMISQIDKVTPTVTNNRLQKVIDESNECSNGGSLYKSGNLDKSGGEVEYHFNNCYIDGELYDGILRVKASNYDYNIKKFKKLKLTYLNDFKTSTETIKEDSTLSVELLDSDDFGDYFKVIADSVSSSDKGLRGFKNFTFVVAEYSLKTSLIIKGGRVYINNLNNFVEYDKSYDMSQSQFDYNSNNILTQGMAQFLMKDATLQIEAYKGEVTINIF